MFSSVLRHLVDGGAAHKIVEPAKKTSHVCVEFGDELLTIRNNCKLCRKLSGEVLWASHLRSDPEEQLNQIMINPNLLQQKKSWAVLEQISEQELKKRRDEKWFQSDYKL